MQESTPQGMSLGCLSSPSSRANLEALDRKTEQRRKLRQVLQELHEANSKHESDLTSQLQEYEEKLELIAAEKRHTTGVFRMKTDAANHEASQCKSSISKAERELKRLESRIRKVEAQMNYEQKEKREAFEYSLHPIEEATELIIEEKQKTEETIASLTAEMEELKQRLVSLTTQETHNRKQIETLQNNKVELSTAFETIKNKYPLEYDEIVKEIETKKKLTELKERKSKHASELRELDKRIAEKERDLNKAVSDLEREERQRSTNRKRAADEGDLIELEKYLKLRTTELGIPYIDKAVEEVSAKNGIDVQNFIMKEQFKIMEHKELTIIERGKEQQEITDSEVAKKSTDAEQLEQMLLAAISNQETNVQLEKKVKDLNSSIRQLRKEGEVAKKQHACRIALIHQWKHQNRKCLLTPENVSWPMDLNILGFVKERMMEKIHDPQQLAAMESILNRYIKALNEREGLANAASEIEVKANNEKKEKEAYIKQLKSGISSLQFERDVLHKDYIRLVNLEKSTLKKFQHCKYEIEVERYRIVNKKLQDSLKKKVPEFLKLQQALGEKNMKSFKDRELSKIKGEHEEKQRKVRNRLEDLYNNFGFWDNQIQHVLDKSISTQIDQVNAEIKKLTNKLKVHQNKLKIVINAEDELKAKIETMIEAKKKEIGKRVSVIIAEHGGGVDYNGIGVLKKSKRESEEQLKHLEETMQEERIRYGQAMEDLEVDETKIKVKLSQLREEAKIVVMNKKKASTLQQKLIKLEREMEKLSAVEAQNQPIQATIPRMDEDSPDISLSEEEEDNKAPPETIESPYASPISRSMELKTLRVTIDESIVSPTQREFFSKVVPLLEGKGLYMRSPGKHPEFNPLMDDLEKSGFSLKMVTVNKHLTKIEIRDSRKVGIEKDLIIKQILRPSIPKHTTEMLAAQKKEKIEVNDELEFEYAEMRRTGIFDFNSSAFIAKSQTANLYPFYIWLKNGSKVVFLSSEYETFKAVVDAVNMLLKFSSVLHQMKYKFQYQ